MPSKTVCPEHAPAAALPQVLGHTKTILVLFIGWKGLGEVMSSRKAAGMALAVLGMVMYGYFSGQQVKPSPKREDKLPLLDKVELGEGSSIPAQSK
jgi:drug/metabolite transporter (DMT)-like permease